MVHDDEDKFDNDGSGSISHEKEWPRSYVNSRELGERESTRRSVVFTDAEPEEIPISEVESNGNQGNKMVQRKNRRTSCVPDLATGMEGGVRGQMAQVSESKMIDETHSSFFVRSCDPQAVEWFCLPDPGVA